MDGLCLKAGIHGVTSQIAVAGGGLDVRTNPSHIAAAVGRTAAAGNGISVEKPTVSGAPPPWRTAPWGFSFKYPLRSLWPGGGRRRDAIALDEPVLVEEKEQEKGGGEAVGDEEGEAGEREIGNWVLKILHVQSTWREEGKRGVEEELRGEEEAEENGAVDDDHRSECSTDDSDEGGDVCRVDDDDKIEIDRDTFSKLLRRVSLTDARLYARMSYLGNLAYAIPQIKPGKLLKFHGLRFVTSSVEKKELTMKSEEEKVPGEEKKELTMKSQVEKVPGEVKEAEKALKEPEKGKEQKNEESRISALTAYRIAASAASYLHYHTKSILPFRSSKSEEKGYLHERSNGVGCNANIMDNEVASLMATTDSVTAVVAAKEEVKQAFADDLKSTHSSPCEWFICDDDLSRTRFFVIQGSETLSSWQANLLFEPTQFEGLDVLVHRGIYEAAKGIYEQMLPEVRAHLKCHGDRATFRFTGHSLGGGLSLLVNLMLLIRGEAPPSSLLPVITFGAPSIMCGGDRLLKELGLPRSHVQSITMHRDIVPRAFSCNYPSHVAELLKAVNGNFRNHPCLNNQRLLYAPMGEFLILQPDEKFSPNHDLLPSGSGLYILSCSVPDANEAEKRRRAARSVFLNSPHPLEILSDRAAYGSEGTIQRDHDMNSYLKSVRNVIRQELNLIRKARREHRRRVWWPLVELHGANTGVIMGRPIASSNVGRDQSSFSGILQTGRESLKRFTRLVASQHMHLLVVLMFPARLLLLGTYSVANFH
ncbi:phospholipase A1 PLIP2, chloroplastic-like isoform X2 [Diospyros lotus]|uniref:phospholipase A1 PLIP2, chloroplastic-like isoform X2 n=1 Tax=Diospyros lotus TaxID=55363 RepID=UPI002255FD4D|nr:phospholipase A1 PLIP2, chloroplastic-like isoform X2 [Diospyros lotus]